MPQEPTALENRVESRGRHPLLEIGKLTGDVYRHLKINGDLTLDRLQRDLKQATPQSVNGAVQRLKNEGLVIKVPTQKGNRVIYLYHAVIENETGFARDKVEIEVTFFVNVFGEYSAVSKVVNEAPYARQSAGIREVHRAKFWAAVPKATEPYKTRVPMEYGGGTVIDVEPNT